MRLSRNGETSVLRGAILAILVLTLLGTVVDLLLIGHTEGIWQLVPVILTGLTLLLLGWHGLQRSRSSILVIQVAMLLLMVCGGVGMFLHHRAKEEFKLEVQPDLSGMKLFWEALMGSTPPSLAPAAMIQAGLLGLAYAYRHPALKPITVETENSNKEGPP